MDRTARLLKDLDIDRLVGLEIGPLDKPLVSKIRNRQIYYADYTDRESLVAKSRLDPNVNTDSIPNIDFIIAPLPLTLGKEFDYIVASHVGEHVPNFIGWVNRLAEWLTPNGVIILALPDRRYTFDCGRQPTSFGEMMEAFLDDRQRPSVASVYDGFSKALNVDPWYLYEGLSPPKPFEHYYTVEQAAAVAHQCHAGEYIDCHCWVFSDDEFKHLLSEARKLRITYLYIDYFSPSTKYSCEFFVHLRVSDASSSLRLSEEAENIS